jgi:hypothetical protein
MLDHLAGDHGVEVLIKAEVLCVRHESVRKTQPADRVGVPIDAPDIWKSLPECIM